MRIVALLSFYDESAGWLATTVAGIGRFCDAVVAVDGAYALFPGARPRSHPQQAEAIMLAAEAADLDCVIHRPADTWAGNEVAKRNHMLRLAGCLEPDWVIVVDADYHLLKCNPDEVRWELRNTEHEVATYKLLDGKDFLGTPALEQYANDTRLDAEWTTETRDIFKWTSELQVGPTHYTYTANGKYFRGGETPTDHLALGDNLVFYHRNADRALERRERAKSYYDIRARERIEA